MAEGGCGVCRLTAVLRQGWEFIDVFACVLAFGHTEPKLEVKTLQQPLSEIVPLNHPEVFYRQISDCELNAAHTHTQQNEALFIQLLRIHMCRS